MDDVLCPVRRKWITHPTVKTSTASGCIIINDYRYHGNLAIQHTYLVEMLHLAAAISCGVQPMAPRCSLVVIVSLLIFLLMPKSVIFNIVP